MTTATAETGPTDQDNDRHTRNSAAAIFIAFVPWIVYWSMSGSDFVHAVLLALGVSVLITVASAVRAKRVYVLEVGTAVVFALLTILALTASEVFMERWMQPLSNGGLLAIALGSVLIGKPFTLQYAEDSVPPEVVALPGFGYINRIITWAWIAAFAIMTAASLVPPIVYGDATIHDGDRILSIFGYWVVPFGALGLAGAFTAKFPDWFSARQDMAEASAGQPLSGPPKTDESAPAAAGGARLSLTPAEGLIDEPVVARIGGLDPGTNVKLTAGTVDLMGNRWQSEATFAAAPDGTVDTGSQAPAEGTWTGADPGALLWSMRYTGDGIPELYIPGPWPSAIDVHAEIEGGSPLGAVATRYPARPGLACRDISEGDVRGVLYTPQGPGPHPGVVLFGGSEGGVDSQRGTAGLLASKGYAAFAASYFGLEGQPEALIRIPLERLTAAITWMRSRSDVSSVAAMAISKGSEGLLAALAHQPEVQPDAVILVSPSSVMWQAIGEQGAVAGTPSWTLGGQDVDFATVHAETLMPEMMHNALHVERNRRRHRPTLLHLVASYRQGLDELPDDSPAVIAAEKVAAPLLLVAGGADELWPSADMALAISARRQASQPAASDDQVQIHSDAGHLIRLPIMPTEARWHEGIAFGGTPEGLARAQASLGESLQGFLSAHLR